MQKLLPDAYFKSVKDVTVHHLNSMKIRGVILDIDDTLSGHNIELFDDDIHQWIDTLKKDGIKICLLSNNSKERAEKAASALGLSGIGCARKPLKSGFRAAAKLMGVSLAETCVIGDQIFTDILGGNRLGLYTVLVDSITAHSSLFFRFKRFVERPVMNRIKRQRR